MFSSDAGYIKEVYVCTNGRGRSSRTSIRNNRRSKHPVQFSRLISKTGRLNIFLSNLPNNKHIVFFRDLGNTLLTIRWRWILIMLCLVNLVCFFLFGFLWMCIAYASGDFDTSDANTSPPNQRCVMNVRSFAGYVLLSIETIMTIGYGYRYPTEQCTQGWLLQMLQAFVSIAIQGVLISVVYVKTAKPFTKNTKSIFTRKAVICLRDGQLSLVVRIIDLAGKIQIGTNITMYFINKDNSLSTDNKSDNNTYFMQQMEIEPYGFLLFPMDIVHVIDSASPLWTLSPLEILTRRFEIVIVAEGSSIVTSQLSQIRTSYVNTDILWGHRFEPCHELDSNHMKYVVNYKRFNATLPFDTPLCSAEELQAIGNNLLQDDQPNGIISKRHQTL